MKYLFKKENNGVFRLKVPFDDLYTSVFLIEGKIPILIDSATTKEDAEDIIIPALKEHGIDLNSQGYLMLTHSHGDHAGGAKYLLSYLPNFKTLALSDEEKVEDIIAYSLKGHDETCFGYLHVPTNTLISGDCLQFYGVSRYGCSINDVAAYEQTLQKVSTLHPTSLLPSHDYAGGAASAFGNMATSDMIEKAKDTWANIKNFVLSNSSTGISAEELQELYRNTFPNLPPLSKITIKNILANR